MPARRIRFPTRWTTTAGAPAAAVPATRKLDLRAGYRIQLGGGRTLDAFLDVFNLTNRANFANPGNR